MLGVPSLVDPSTGGCHDLVQVVTVPGCVAVWGKWQIVKGECRYIEDVRGVRGALGDSGLWRERGANMVAYFDHDLAFFFGS